jgi:hypothetical protein
MWTVRSTDVPLLWSWGFHVDSSFYRRSAPLELDTDVSLLWSWGDMWTARSTDVPLPWSWFFETFTRMIIIFVTGILHTIFIPEKEQIKQAQ